MRTRKTIRMNLGCMDKTPSGLLIHSQERHGQPD
jgi:hypothetical protein